MLRSITMLAILAALFLQVGCSGAGSSTRRSNSYRESLGATSRAQLITTIEELLFSKYQYQSERIEDSVEDIYVETRWRDQITLDDEAEQGYTFIRTRVIITARPRNRTPGTAASYSVTFRAEYMVRIQGGDWSEAPITDMRRREIRQLSREIKTELTTGIRVI